VDLWKLIAAERLALADELDGLTAQQWATPSLCSAWTVRDVAAHLVVPFRVKLPRFLLTLIRARGKFARANVALTAREAVRPTADLVADLRRNAEDHFAPPGMGPVAPLTDVLVHGQDIRDPLGLGDQRPAEPWGPVLDFLVSPKARRGFVSGRIPALRYRAADLDWSFGETGEEVTGPAAALALTLLGRPARAGELSGAGAAELAKWAGA
jgi:uncharacterized protein (TIGR03083 family)